MKTALSALVLALLAAPQANAAQTGENGYWGCESSLSRSSDGQVVNSNAWLIDPSSLRVFAQEPIYYESYDAPSDIMSSIDIGGTMIGSMAVSFRLTQRQFKLSNRMSSTSERSLAAGAVVFNIQNSTSVTAGPYRFDFSCRFLGQDEQGQDFRQFSETLALSNSRQAYLKLNTTGLDAATASDATSLIQNQLSSRSYRVGGTDRYHGHQIDVSYAVETFPRTLRDRCGPARVFHCNRVHTFQRCTLTARIDGPYVPQKRWEKTFQAEAEQGACLQATQQFSDALPNS